MYILSLIQEICLDLRGQMEQPISFISKNLIKTSVRKKLSEVVQIFYYVFSGRWPMMLLPRKHFLAHSWRTVQSDGSVLGMLLLFK